METLRRGKEKKEDVLDKELIILGQSGKNLIVFSGFICESAVHNKHSSTAEFEVMLPCFISASCAFHVSDIPQTITKHHERSDVIKPEDEHSMSNMQSNLHHFTKL